LRLAELLLVVAASGCMRIDADADRPDVEVSWAINGVIDTPIEEDCARGTVQLTLTGIDDPTTRFEFTRPCTDETVTLVDLPPQRFQLASALRGSANELLARIDEDTIVPLDLRSGLDKETSVLFTQVMNIAVEWKLADDATCDSLGADTIELRFTPASGTPVVIERPCLFSGFYGRLLPGVYAIEIRALANSQPVATASASAIAIDELERTDVPRLELVPCGDSCD
jgi:hypothetical protein